jgi:ABC-type multidrug transport system fused ATPase/permease subunit
MQHYKNNYQQLNIGSIVTKLVHIPVIISDIFDLVQGYFLPNLLIFVMTVIYLFYINKTLGAIALASLTYLVYNLYNKTAACVNISTSTESSQNHLNDHVEDMINNLLTIYTSGTEKEELEKLKQYHKIHAHHFSSTLLCTSHINRLSTYMSGLFFSSVAAFALYLYVNKNIPLYQFISVLTISLWIVDRIGTIEDKTRELVKCLGLENLILQFLIIHLYHAKLLEILDLLMYLKLIILHLHLSLFLLKPLLH